jgi:predicted AAA+ superfamily ATPase
LPALLNEVHRLIEERKLTFIMTGSSARTLRRRGVNLLAGRAYTFHLYPLTAAELGSSFSLSFSLQHGHLPSLYSAAENPELFLDSYIETYLREEVLQEGVTRNLGSFSRFLEAAAFSQGSVLNISDVARESGIERRTVSNYFDILEDLLLAFRLPVFTRRAKRRLISHSKFYYFDAGVFRAIRPAGPLDRPQEIEGQALETLCIQELKAVNEYYGMGYSLHFWRTSHGVEVDCVLYGERGLIAIEVKHSSRIHARSIRGLRLFLSDYPEARAYLFYMGKREEYWEGIHVIPVDKALRSLPGLLSGSQPHGAEDSQGSKKPQEI